MKKKEWWDNKGGFFGEGYMQGDDSEEGFRPDRTEDLVSRTLREAEGVTNLLGKNIHSILDLPCGYGRHSRVLSQMGFEVVGMDINDTHLKKASLDSKARIIKGDMRDIGKEHYGRYDAVINMWYSFGFFSDERDNVKTMQEFCNALTQGGQLLLHTDVSPEILEGGKYRLREVRTLKKGKLIQEEWYDPVTKRMNGIWTVCGRQLEPYSVRIYSRDEFEHMATRVGFNEVKFYGSFEKEPFTPQSAELIMVARK